MITDLVANALTMIRNASLRGKETVNIPASSALKEIIRIFKEENFIKDFRVLEDDRQGSIRVYLKYTKSNESAISHIKRISKPGLRIYKGKKEIPIALGGLGVTILTTSRGILTDKEAKAKGVGGEIICQIW
ncbi:MAG: 30S ribosomal protein S8 [Candidatus Omnitrophica bacterium]|nr:30S ribosomal protein S8 [Candidatus Omnitrophota bacterium]